MKSVINKYHDPAKGKRQGKIDRRTPDKCFCTRKTEGYENDQRGKQQIREKIKSERHWREQGCKAEYSARKTPENDSEQLCPDIQQLLRAKYKKEVDKDVYRY